VNVQSDESAKKIKGIVMIIGHTVVWSIQVIIGIKSGEPVFLIVGVFGLTVIGIFVLAASVKALRKQSK